MNAKLAFAVYGAGGHGKVVADVAVSAGQLLQCFIDDAPRADKPTVAGVPVLAWPTFRDRAVAPRVTVALGIGDNVARAQSADRIAQLGLTVITAIHPRAVLAASAKLGAGTVVMANAVVNPEATIGHGCILNTGSITEHDVLLGDFVLLGPNASLGGGVQIGARSFIGLGATVLPGVHIGEDAIIGAGAVVVRNVAAGATVVGNPARSIVHRHG